jgi:hypothetical protein
MQRAEENLTKKETQAATAAEDFVNRPRSASKVGTAGRSQGSWKVNDQIYKISRCC